MLVFAIGVFMFATGQGFVPGAVVDSMKGVTDLRVVVEDIPEAPEMAAATRTAIELKLRQNGITVHPTKTSFMPYVYMNIGLIKLDDDTHYVYAVRTEFRRLTELNVVSEKQSKVLWASFWDSSLFGIVPKDRYRERIRETVDEVVNEFLNKYLEANPVKR